MDIDNAYTGDVVETTITTPSTSTITTAPSEEEIRAEIAKQYKDAMDKASAQAKKYKDAMREAQEKLKSYMTDEERKAQEVEDHYRTIEEENARLKRDMTISQKTAFYLNLGFDGELAKETAEAFVDGDFETVERNQLKAHEEFEKAIRADVVRSTPHPQNSGTGTIGLTKAQIMAEKDAIKRQNLIKENIELFQ